MIIINKKRMGFIFLVLIISVISYSIKQNNQNIVSVSSLPVTNKVIILDAGHGQPDEGASGSSGVTEESINLVITKKVQNLLESSGSIVLLTRSDENGIYDSDSSSIRNKKISDIKNRVKIGNESSADIFVASSQFTAFFIGVVSKFS